MCFNSVAGFSTCCVNAKQGFCSPENPVGTQVCVCVLVEAVNSIEICTTLHCILLFSYADGMFSDSTDDRPFQVVIANI